MSKDYIDGDTYYSFQGNIRSSMSISRNKYKLISLIKTKRIHQLIELINSDGLDQELFFKMAQKGWSSMDNGWNVFHGFCRYYPEHLEVILNSKYMNQELFNSVEKNNQRRNCLHIIADEHPKYLKVLLESEYMNNYVFHHISFYQQSILHTLLQSKKLKLKYFKLLLESEYLNKELFDETNYWNETIFYCCCKHYVYKKLKDKGLLYVINHKFFSKELLYIRDIYRGNKLPIEKFETKPSYLLILYDDEYLSDDEIQLKINILNKINIIRRHMKLWYNKHFLTIF